MPSAACRQAPAQEGGETFEDVVLPHLDAAYRQLLQYRESLQNPPLLIVSDFRWLVIHTNFTNAVNYDVTLTLDDLATVQGLQLLRSIFFNVEAFRPRTTGASTLMRASGG